MSLSIALMAVWFLSAEPNRQEQSGTVCVAPRSTAPPTTSSPDVPECPSDNLFLKIDNQPPIEWPRTRSVPLPALEWSQPHRVTVMCDKKPQQSFKFRFSEFADARSLCLFLNDLYQTVQLWDRKRAPWCKCEGAPR